MSLSTGLERTGSLEDRPRLIVDQPRVPPAQHDPHEEAKAEIAAASHAGAGFFLMNLFAAVVASYGLLSDSTAVVIGAMVIAVLLGPIAGIGLAIVISDKRLFYRAALAVILGSIEVLLVSYAIGSLHVLPTLTNELLARTQPNLFDLMIALAGGAAGAYAVARRVPGGTMIGVAIATALVPPLCTVGITAAYGEWALSSNALLLFFSNFVAIQCAYSLVLFILRFRPHASMRLSTRLTQMLPSLIIFSGLAVFLGSQLQDRVERRKIEVALDDALRKGLAPIPGAHLAEVQFSAGDTLAVVASVNTPDPIEPHLVTTLERMLVGELDRPLQLSVRSILMKVANRERYLFEEEELNQITSEPQQTTKPLTPAQLDSILFGKSSIRGDSVALQDSVSLP